MPTNNAVNISANGIVKYDGAGTFSSTTTTQYNVLVGNTANAIANVAPSATSGVPLISQGASANPTFGTAVVAGGGTGTATLPINGALFSGTTTTSAVSSATLTSGQLLIGGTTTPAAATLTAGTGVSITNGNNSITINAVGGALTWSVVTVNASFTVNTGTIANKAGLLTMTLPNTASVGDIIEITGINTALGWLIAQNANQQIFYGTLSTTLGVAGSLSSINIRDSVKLVCVVAGSSTVYNVLSSVGNITVT